jgi:hypothetical protein
VRETVARVCGVQSKARTKGATSATNASPLIVSVTGTSTRKGVVFIKNGKKVGTATVK